MFIFESIGTQELLLIGLAALIFLGPRRMPEIARKIGKLMSDFRNTTSDFKATWEREVNFEHEARQLKDLTNFNEDNDVKPVARENSIRPNSEPIELPEIKAVDPAQFEKAAAATAKPQTIENAAVADPNTKEHWL
ncbi:MAG TPA: twin-arginine translocase TatA/TatE family subunit [Pyrinomonadaceae bacterium]